MELEDICIAGLIALLTAGMITAENRGNRTVPYQEVSKPIEYNIKTYPVDQIFKDHNGYRIIFTDENQLVQEQNIGNLTYNIPQGRVSCGEFWNYPPTVTNPELLEYFRGLRESPVDSAHIYKDLTENKRGEVRILDYSIKTTCYAEPREGLHMSYVEMHLPKSQKISPGFDHIKKGKNTHEHPAIIEIKMENKK